MPIVVAGEAVEDGMAACADDGVVGSWVHTFPNEHTEVPEDGTGVSAADDDRGGTNGGIPGGGIPGGILNPGGGGMLLRTNLVQFHSPTYI